MSVQLQVRLPFDTLRSLVRQLPPAQKKLLLRDLEADAASELEQQKREVLARHQQKATRSDRFVPKDEGYYQTMTPVLDVLTAEFEPLAAAAVEAYEAFLEGKV
ncbi:MAG: hypothetical protein WBW48_13685 [Anaerolineae bacterium]